MAAVNLRAEALTAPPEHRSLFKEDRPRQIDRFISFFGDEDSVTDDVCGERVLDAFSTESWSER